MFLHSLSSFLCKHCICGHKCDDSIVDMPSLRCEPPKLILRFGEPQPLGSIYLPCGKFDMLSLYCEPPKLILRFGEPQPLKLDMI